jgi:hypothetical protein
MRWRPSDSGAYSYLLGLYLGDGCLAEPRRVRPRIRGLIHSDGSGVINRFETLLPSGRVAQYAYPRCFFTNYSADIRRIFCEHRD